MRILRGIKWLGFTAVVLATFVWLAVAFENYRGKRAWLAFAAELGAQGERLDVEALRPPPVPDEQNFAMTPLLAPLHDYQIDARTRQAMWRDTNASERPKHLFEWRSRARARAGGWREGEFLDLIEWQQDLRQQTNSHDPEIKALLSTPVGPPEADLLFLLGLNEAELGEVRAALQRPHANFKIHMEEGFNVLLPELSVMKSFAGAFQLKAVAELAAGRTAAAFADTRAAFAISDALRTEPLLIAGLVRIASLEIGLQPLWEGLARHQWTADQAAQFQAQLGRINLVDEMQRDLRGERIFCITTLDLMRRDRKEALGSEEGGWSVDLLRYMPSGWFYRNEVTIGRLFQAGLGAFDPVRRTVDLALADRTAGDAEQQLRQKHPYTIFASMLVPAINKSVAKTGRTQASVNLAATACALERFREHAGRYPENLDALVPRFMERLPVDPVNGEPLRYRLLDDGRFVLYSVGLNRKDDGGTAWRDKKGRVQPDQAEGDWVWQYPGR
jgi:hypothetical protein